MTFWVNYEMDVLISKKKTTSKTNKYHDPNSRVVYFLFPCQKDDGT